MITKMNRLGCLLFAVLSLFIVGGVTLVFSEYTNYLSSIALGSVILFLCIVFMGYLFYDAYILKQEKYLQNFNNAQSL